jgi:hypothetical protein
MGISRPFLGKRAIRWLEIPREAGRLPDTEPYDEISRFLQQGYCLQSGSDLRAIRLGGSVFDPSGAAIKGAAATIQNPVSHYAEPLPRMTRANSSSRTSLTTTITSRLPHPVSRRANRIWPYARPIPVDVKITLKPTPTSIAPFRQAAARKPILLAQFAGDAGHAGISADSNGLFHGLGDHASNSFSLDGQPITDQQSKVFSNQIPSMPCSRWR